MSEKRCPLRVGDWQRFARSFYAYQAGPPMRCDALSQIGDTEIDSSDLLIVVKVYPYLKVGGEYIEPSYIFERSHE